MKSREYSLKNKTNIVNPSMTKISINSRNITQAHMFDSLPQSLKTTMDYNDPEMPEAGSPRHAQSKPREAQPPTQDFNLYQKTEAVRSLWDRLVRREYERDVGFVTEISIKQMNQWMVEERLAVDKDKCELLLEKEIGCKIKLKE